jgi:hypothetical protein
MRGVTEKMPRIHRGGPQRLSVQNNSTTSTVKRPEKASENSLAEDKQRSNFVQGFAQLRQEGQVFWRLETFLRG